MKRLRCFQILGKLLSDEELMVFSSRLPKRLSFGLFGAGISEVRIKGRRAVALPVEGINEPLEAQNSRRVEVCSIYDDTTYFLLVERFF